MWDLTVPGNNDHDFYVVTSLNAGVKPLDPIAVLVHNSELGLWSSLRSQLERVGAGSLQ
jgi:hypothetical protein